MRDKALIVVSFGTTHMDTLTKTITNIETDLQKAFPKYDFIRVFTSSIIRNKLKKHERMEVFSPEEAFSYLIENSYRDVIIQPTHIIPGSEYQKIINIFENSPKEMKIVIGHPLLYEHRDFILLKDFFDSLMTRLQVSSDTAVLLMGHGTENKSNLYYPALDYYLNENSPFSYYVATVEGYPEFKTVQKRILKNHKKVLLMPLMIVAGEHVKNDMIENDDSWKNRLIDQGLDVEVFDSGLGEFQEIRRIFIDHAKSN